MNTEQALLFLKQKDHERVLVDHSIASLGWDYETILPEAGVSERAEQLGYLSALGHRIATDPQLEEAVETLGNADLCDAERALVRKYEKFFRTDARIPSSLVEEKAVVSGEAHAAWLLSREQDDPSIFQPYLEKLIAISKEEAAISAPEKPCYDALLDKYEEGMTMEVLDEVFTDLEEYLHSLLDRIGDQQVDSSFLLCPYETSELHDFCLGVVKRMGFDFRRGLVGHTAHPFTTTLGCDDIRISTRYTDPQVSDPIFSLVHECGHALYEQSANLNPEIRGTSLANGTSLGIHESQSRFWENLMGRSLSFWQFCYPELQKRVPSLAEIPLEDFWKGLCKVAPSAIRVNADEVTYPLHIILRYRIEKLIFSEDIPLKELPDMWNMLSEEILRYKPRSFSEGILQDCHWSQCSFGYFPTYALGGLYGASFRSALLEDIGGEGRLDDALRCGNWSLITNWQREKIWKHGSLLKSAELLFQVTGQTLSAADFKAYLEEKYSKIYRL